MKTKSVKFIESPVSALGLAYFVGEVAEFEMKQAEELIAQGYAIDAAPVNSLPEDLPGRDKLFDLGFKSVDDLKEVADFSELEGISKTMATKIKTYLA